MRQPRYCDARARNLPDQLQTTNFLGWEGSVWWIWELGLQEQVHVSVTVNCAISFPEKLAVLLSISIKEE